LNILNRIVRSFLWRSGLGALIGSSFWRVVSEGDDILFLYHNTKSVFEDIPVEFDDGVYSKFIKKDSQKWSKQEEYVLVVHNAIVEPERCMIILSGRRILEQSRDFKLEKPYPFIFDYYFKNRKKTF
jgi:hypothetical protein